MTWNPASVDITSPSASCLLPNSPKPATRWNRWFWRASKGRGGGLGQLQNWAPLSPEKPALATWWWRWRSHAPMRETPCSFVAVKSNRWKWVSQGEGERPPSVWGHKPLDNDPPPHVTPDWLILSTERNLFRLLVKRDLQAVFALSSSCPETDHLWKADLPYPS